MATAAVEAVRGFKEEAELTKWTNELVENLAEQNDEILALESIYEGEGDEELEILQRPSLDASDIAGKLPSTDMAEDFFTLMFRIPVVTNDEAIHIDICMPEDKEQPENQPTKLQYKRSDSGHRIFGSFMVNHLTPLRLVAVLSPEYPSHAPPLFTLRSDWLTHMQLSSLCHALDELWTESPSMPILYTWVDWLKNNSMSHLGFTNHLVLDQTENQEVVDARALSECDDVIATAEQLLRYNQYRKVVLFQKEDHDCPVCFVEYPGRNFVQLNECGHFLCVECATDLCRHHVQEGTVFDLRCPESKCDTEIPPYIVQKLLSDEEFARFEKLALSKALDRMRDIVWCPRCHQPVIKDNKMKHGQCANCFFSFCTKCMEPWHQGTLCSLELERKRLADEERQKLFQAAEEKREEAIARQKRKMQEGQSRAFVSEFCKQCPNCEMDIMKDGGCNKVFCSYCKASMCWRCGKDITVESYNHFTDSPNCQGFDNVLPVVMQFAPRIVRPPVLDELDQELAAFPERRENLFRCPKCKQRNMKRERNNHVKCWACGRNICFLCREIISVVPITKHFARDSLCKQHT